MSTLATKPFTAFRAGEAAPRLLAALRQGFRQMVRHRSNRAALFAGQDAVLALELSLRQPSQQERDARR